MGCRQAQVGAGFVVVRLGLKAGALGAGGAGEPQTGQSGACVSDGRPRWVPRKVTEGERGLRDVERSERRSVVSHSLRPHGLRSSPGQNTMLGSLSLLQGIFPTQGLNWGLPHCGCILYQRSH